MVAKRMVHGRTWIGLVLLAGILMPTTALAHHRPNRHCSESGDVCAGTMKYRNCGDYGSGWPLNTSPGIVCESRAPDGTRSCKSLRIRKTGSTYGDSVRWRRNFPDKGPALTKYAGEQVASAAHYLASTSRGDRPLWKALAHRSRLPAWPCVSLLDVRHPLRPRTRRGRAPSVHRHVDAPVALDTKTLYQGILERTPAPCRGVRRQGRELPERRALPLTRAVVNRPGFGGGS